MLGQRKARRYRKGKAARTSTKHMNYFYHMVLLTVPPRFEMGPNDSKTFKGCTRRQALFSLKSRNRYPRQKPAREMMTWLIRVHGVQRSLSVLVSLICQIVALDLTFLHLFGWRQTRRFRFCDYAFFCLSTCCNIKLDFIYIFKILLHREWNFANIIQCPRAVLMFVCTAILFCITYILLLVYNFVFNIPFKLSNFGFFLFFLATCMR